MTLSRFKVPGRDRTFASKYDKDPTELSPSRKMSIKLGYHTKKATTDYTESNRSRLALVGRAACSEEGK